MILPPYTLLPDEILSGIPEPAQGRMDGHPEFMQPSNHIQPAESADVRIERHYTRAILSGELPSGTRLPPSNEMAKSWSVSANAVQKAMRRLSAAGLVARERKSGTTVRGRTERALVGLIIGPSLSDETTHYHRALVTALEDLLSRRQLSCRVYDGVHPGSLPAIRDYRPLDMLRVDRVYYTFKGLIMLQPGPAFAALVSDPLPRAIYASSNETTDIVHDQAHFSREVLQGLGMRGRRHVLAVSTRGRTPVPTSGEESFSSDEALPGMKVEHCVVPLLGARGYHIEESAFDTMLKIISEWKKDPSKKPDAVVVTDDILARGVCMALLKSQVEVPRDLEVVVKATESIQHHYGMPVHRYEFSCAETARHLEDLLWRRIMGEPLPPLPIVQKGKFRPAEIPAEKIP